MGLIVRDECEIFVKNQTYNEISAVSRLAREKFASKGTCEKAMCEAHD